MIIDTENGLVNYGIDYFYFSGGEPHVKIPVINDSIVQIKCRITNWEEMGFLCALLSALGNQAVTHETIEQIDLYLPYFPGSRQDRTDGQSPLTAQMYAAMLSASIGDRYGGGFDIHTFDMHSEEGARVVHWAMTQYIYGADTFVNHTVSELDVSDFDDHYDIILAPDKGAVGRAQLFRDTFYPDAMLVTAEKEREFSTGHIIRYDVQEIAIDGAKILVVDDICDGGKTFTILGESIKKMDWGETFDLQLYVSHGIFSKTPEILEDHYSKIYTTDSLPHMFYEIDYPNVVEIPVPDVFANQLQGSTI